MAKARTNTNSGKLRTVRFYLDRKKNWRWTLKAANGEKIANGGQGYARRIDAIKTFLLVAKEGPIVWDQPDMIVTKGWIVDNRLTFVDPNGGARSML